MKYANFSIRSLSATCLAVTAMVFASRVNAAPDPSNIPASASHFPAPDTLLVWVGMGVTSIYVDGAWRRSPGNDYEFSVTQRRYSDRWESIKVIHRRHPGYDGSAGPRDQTHYFRVDLPTSSTEPNFPYKLTSSLGNGTGRFDREFREGRMQIDAKNVSMFAPFNQYRITQQYKYEQGELMEVVELFKAKNETESPFMRIEERASLLAPHRFNSAPDKLK
jgi:hypothetical protein